MFKNLLYLFTCLIMISCGGNAGVKTDNANAPATNNQTTPQKAPETTVITESANEKMQNSTPLESIPQATVMKMWEECTYIDYIFHHLPFSMSQDEQSSIRANLGYISTEPQAFLPAKCKPMARQFFQVNGEIVLEADVYLSKPCKFYVFVENEKPVYANKMTPAGEQFFQNMFAQTRPAKNPYGQQTPYTQGQK